MPYGYPAYTSPEMMKRIQEIRSPEFQAEQQIRRDEIALYKNLLNNVTPSRVLTVDEKRLQFLILNGDIENLFKLVPNSHWNTNTPLDKYSFRDVNGRRQKVPLTPEIIERYVFSRHLFMDAGFMPQAHHRESLTNRFVESKETIYPGRKYVPAPRRSTWDKLKKPLLIAAGVVAAIYLGPIVVDKIGALYGSGSAAATGTGAAGEVSAKATFFAKVKSGANTVLGYVNKARTVEAIVKGEMPPPPIGITGDSFKEWVFDLAKKEITDAAKEKAAELGTEYIQREMTKREEAKLRDEIAAMQIELAALIPESTPMQPASEVSTQIVDKMIEKKEQSKDLNNVLMLAVPLGMAYFLTS